jgi:hypothetical protein
MKTFSKIVYRQSDTALMILPLDENENTDIRFVNNLSDEQKLSFIELNNFLLTEVDELDYCTYSTNNNMLSVQPIHGITIELLIDELDTNNKLIVDNVLAICTKLLNN